MLRKEAVIFRIERAFSPLRCRTEFRDGERKLGFVVFGAAGEKILEVNDLVLSDISDAQNLYAVLRQAQAIVHEKIASGRGG